MAQVVEFTTSERQGPISMVSCQKGPTRHAYTWQIGPFWQDTLDLSCIANSIATDVLLTQETKVSSTMPLV